MHEYLWSVTGKQIENKHWNYYRKTLHVIINEPAKQLVKRFAMVSDFVGIVLWAGEKTDAIFWEKVKWKHL